MAMPAASRAQAYAAAGDAVVWMHDAVTLALAGVGAPGVANGVREFVLREDLRARGLADLPLRAGVDAIDYAQLVALCAADRAVPVTWGWP
jgi:sulfur relay protein TusB/DsrH